VSVVLPAHNEEVMLPATVAEIVAGLRARGAHEVLIVENGSRDATAALSRSLAAELPEVRALSMPNADYGLALRAGFLAARGELVAIFDVDYYDLRFLDAAVALLEGSEEAVGAPVAVLASKRAPGARDDRPLTRRVVTSAFSVVLRRGFGLGVSDTHGMKVLRRAPLVAVAERCRFGTDLFDTELVLRAERSGMRVAEIPVAVAERRPSRSSILRRVLRTLGGLVRLRLALWEERLRRAGSAPSRATRRSGR
jgi:glycosyltransferase involved in cell wall biosynthesis